MVADSVPPHQAPRRLSLAAWLRDARVLNILGQIVFAIILIAAVSAIWTSILTSLQAKNLTPNTNFLADRAGFDISERPAWYSSSSTYAEAFRVGVENSLRIIGLGLVLTTIIGILGGIFLLSSNWLLRSITRVIVELLRNTPLLVQLIGWYFVVMLSLPLFQDALTFPQESVWVLAWRFALYLALIVAAVVVTRLAWFTVKRRAYLWAGLLGALITVEGLFVVVPRQFGSLQLTSVALWSVLLGSALVWWVCWRYAQASTRWRGIGGAIGAIVGSLLFFVGLLPTAAFARFEVYPAMILSKRGFVIPEFLPSTRFGWWLAIVISGLIAAAIAWIVLARITEQTGRPTQHVLWSVVIAVSVAILGWVAVSLPPPPATMALPQKDSTTLDMTVEEAISAGVWTRDAEQQYSRWPLLYVPPVQKISPAGIISGLASGTQITPEYMALLLGLVIYTAAFVAEIVRAGILAVPNGQLEASRALGLSTSQTLSLIILPQALRIIIPPLGNQYLNLSKNSSLAIAVAYADLVFVTQTIMNQSGQSVTGITMIMLTYLAISLVLAWFVNLVNRRFRIVTR